jgi:hypothetical protein
MRLVRSWAAAPTRAAMSWALHPTHQVGAVGCTWSKVAINCLMASSRIGIGLQSVVELL